MKEDSSDRDAMQSSPAQSEVSKSSLPTPPMAPAEQRASARGASAESSTFGPIMPVISWRWMHP